MWAVWPRNVNNVKRLEAKIVDNRTAKTRSTEVKVKAEISKIQLFLSNGVDYFSQDQTDHQIHKSTGCLR